MSHYTERLSKLNLTADDEQLQKVIKNHHNKVDKLARDISAISEKTCRSIESSEALLKELGYKLPAKPVASITENKRRQSVKLRDWGEIVQEAEKAIDGEVSITELLSDSDIVETRCKIKKLRKEFDLDHKLDGLDYAIAGISGTLGALIDIFLVKMPSSPGYLGGEGIKGGCLSDFFRKLLKGIYSPEKIRSLEKANWVPYDAATSTKLTEKVEGLYPRSHRLQSLGHDPVLGFIFGVRDIMNGQMTAVDKFGNLIVQDIPGAPTGVGLFEAIVKQIGHLKSDIGTAAGLPAPFLSLFQLIQAGSFGEKGRTVAELSRYMYLKGYDFGYFLAMSVPVMIIEVLVRTFYFLKRMQEGHGFIESLPLNIAGQPRKPKLQTMLLTAHVIATAANAGKVYFTQNPLAINLPQWLWMCKSTYHQIKWLVWEKENERLAHTQEKLDEDWQSVNDKLSEQWAFT